MKKYFLILFCFISMFAHGQVLEKFINMGFGNIDKKDYKNAAVSFNAAKDLITKNTDKMTIARLYMGYSIVHYATGDQKRALSDLEYAISVKRSFATLYNVRSSMYEERKNYNAALADLDTYLVYKPDNPQIMTKKVRLLIKMKKYVAAKYMCNKLIEINPNDYNDCGLYAEVYRNEKKYDSGLYIVNKGLALEPSNGKLYSTRATLYHGMEKVDECEKDNLKSMEIDKELEPYAYNNIAYYVDATRKDWKKMLEDCNKAIAVQPEFSYPYSNKGYALLMLGRLEEGRTELEKAGKMDPDNSYVMYYMAVYYQLQGKNSKSCALLKKALAIDMDDDINGKCMALQKQLKCN